MVEPRWLNINIRCIVVDDSSSFINYQFFVIFETKILTSLFIVGRCITRSLQNKPVSPWRGLSHQFTHGIEAHSRICLNDYFVMYVHHDTAMLESLHGIAENVSGNCLHDVFHELGTVAFDAFPFLCSTNTFIGNTLAAKLVYANAGFYIGKLSA